ncbi:hypothetical protein PHSY_000388 [Pseudozyma hubeiensis SY62]|uniref:Uncharacterized protein n=1 Tax=Pseudozyma hubeiensis (strain SY62) TaxID=1305764 RepID=R9NWJ8_PSEHS|nr:hypothetical protein PHSY_000388 [Pseudozyma hubeiensis SY62]GAC92832.1 hypothetical protein PHSY_000388 [Pseudozyma hubeiensis SY62]
MRRERRRFISFNHRYAAPTHLKPRESVSGYERTNASRREAASITEVLSSIRWETKGEALSRKAVAKFIDRSKGRHTHKVRRRSLRPERRQTARPLAVLDKLGDDSGTGGKIHRDTKEPKRRKFRSGNAPSWPSTASGDSHAGWSPERVRCHAATRYALRA